MNTSFILAWRGILARAFIDETKRYGDKTKSGKESIGKMSRLNKWVHTNMEEMLASLGATINMDLP